MRKISKTKKNRRGFTLVELIVVLVILAILAALLVPALTGYIDRAREKKIIAECRGAVVAAQTIESEQYAKEKGGYVTKAANFTEVEQLAEVPGKVKEIQVSSVSSITYLEYENSGVTAIYEKAHEPEYYIKDGSRSGSAVNDLSGFKQYEEYLKAGQGEEGDRWRALVEWMEANNMTDLPKVSEGVKKGTNYENEELYWRPYYIGNNKKEGLLVYYANGNPMKSNDGSGLDKDSKSADRWNGELVYVNDKVYQYTGSSASGKSLSQLYRCKSYEEVEELLKNPEMQFEEVK